MSVKSSDYSPEELMAVVISREVRDFETIGVGASSPIPAAGCILALQLHAPHSNLIILGSKEYYPFTRGAASFTSWPSGGTSICSSSAGSRSTPAAISTSMPSATTTLPR